MRFVQVPVRIRTSTCPVSYSSCPNFSCSSYNCTTKVRRKEKIGQVFVGIRTGTCPKSDRNCANLSENNGYFFREIYLTRLRRNQTDIVGLVRNSHCLIQPLVNWFVVSCVMEMKYETDFFEVARGGSFWRCC